MVFNGVVTVTPVANPIRIGDAAGGDLTGTYPNPTIQLGAVVRNRIASSAIGTDEIENASVTSAKLTNAIISGNKIVSNSILQGHLASGIITNAHIANNADISLSKLQNHDLFVQTIGNQTISGIKKFHRARVPHNPQLWFDIANKGYVDSTVASGVGGGGITEVFSDKAPKLGNHLNTNGYGLIDYTGTGILISGTPVLGGLTTTPVSASSSFEIVRNSYAISRLIAINNTPTYGGLQFLQRARGFFGSESAPVDDDSLGWNYFAGHTGLAYGTAGAVSVKADGDHGPGSTAGKMGLWTTPSGSTSAIERVTVRQDGDVGINVTNPEEKLHVDGNIKLTGNLIGADIVSGNNITTNSILQGHLADNIIGADQIVNSSISGNKIQSQSILNGHIAHSAISGNVTQANSILQGHVENGYVDLSSNQTISGTKIFHRIQAAGNPIEDKDLTTKEYVDSNTTTAAGNRTEFLVTHQSHGFSQGDIVRHNGSTYVKSRADNIDNAEVYGFINEIVDPDNYKLVTHGDVIKSGISAGNVYFLSPITAGDVTISEPITSGYVSKPLLLAKGPISAIFNNTRGFVITSGNSGDVGLSTSFVDLATDQIVSGTKIFHRIQAAGNPIEENDLVIKSYADSLSGGGVPDDASVSGNKIAANSILIGHLANNVISGNIIQPNVILNNHLALNSVSGNSIQTNGILEGHLGTFDGCRIGRSTNFTLNNAVFTKIPMDEQTYDRNDLHDVTSGNNYRIAFKKDGIYSLSAELQFASNATGRRGVRILHNNDTEISKILLFAGTTGSLRLSTATNALVSVNDFVEVEGYQNRGGTLDVELAIFTAQWLGN